MRWFHVLLFFYTGPSAPPSGHLRVLSFFMQCLFAHWTFFLAGLCFDALLLVVHYRVCLRFSAFRLRTTGAVLLALEKSC